jgi:hypothetical protein
LFFFACFVDCQQWKSNLKDAGITVSKFLRPLNCELVNNTSPNQCSSWDVTEENVSALLSIQAQKCTGTSDDWGRQLSDTTSVSAASGGQHISKHTSEDYACKQFLDLCFQSVVHHEILISFKTESADLFHDSSSMFTIVILNIYYCLLTDMV